jgi:transcriptional regulator with XRE-family HTH domain
MSQGSAAMRRRLRVELKRLRTERGLTQREVAGGLEWSPSKIIRIENGSVSVSVVDLRALLGVYGVEDHQRVETLTDLARSSKRQPWTHFKDILTPETIKYLGYVLSASVVRQFQTILIPGLLQIEEYTTALMSSGFGHPDEVVERYVEFRQEYRTILASHTPPQVSFILDEGILRRAVGGPSVMAHQLRHIEEVASLPNVEVRILPFSAGVHYGMGGPFTYLEFPDPELDDVIYMDDPLGERISKDDPDAATRYLQAFLDLEQRGCQPAETPSYLERAIQRLPRDAAESAAS